MAGIRKFLNESAIYGLGSVASRLFAFILIPIYIDSLGKAQYANVMLLQLMFTLLTFAFALNSGVFYYYYEYKSETLKKSIITSWLAYQILVFVFLAILLTSFYPSIKFIFDDVGNTASIKNAFTFMLASLFPFIFNNTYYNTCRIKREPFKAILTTVSEIVLLLILVILLIKVYGYGIEGVFLAQLISKGMVTVAIFFTDFRKYFVLKLISLKLTRLMIGYSWPYFLISSFFWIMSSVDKFLGTELLDSHEQIAYLALATQITLPIGMFVDVIRQAYGPYVMSIRKDEDANESYVKIFSFVIFIGVFLCVGLISIAPFLILILADETFYPALNVIPYFALAAVFNLMLGKFSLGLNLTKRNGYLAIGVIAGGAIGFVLNFFLLEQIGIVGAGVSQVVAYLLSAITVFYFANSKMKINYEFGWMFLMLGVLIAYISWVLYLPPSTDSGFYFYYVFVGIFVLALLFLLGNKKFALLKSLSRKQTNG